MKNLYRVLTFWGLCVSTVSWAQRIPNEVENIDYLITYGKQFSSSYKGYYKQVIFFSIPLETKSPIHIRVYDPDTGGTHDELHGAANTTTRYSVYEGKSALSPRNSQKNKNPIDSVEKGNLLMAKIFNNNGKYDASWFTFGPFNPLQGEKSEKLGGYIFKLVVEGLQGNDGNQYRCFLSEHPSLNRSVDGANIFTYKYTFKLPKTRGFSHIYPFVDPYVTAIIQNNYDYEKDGEILIYSVAKNRHIASVSGKQDWANSKHQIEDEEKNTTIDIQIKKDNLGDNAMSFYVTNQYNQLIPFFAVPIGGPPRYKYDVQIFLKSD